MSWFEELLTITNFFSPVIETAKDISYTVENGNLPVPIEVDFSDLKHAQRVLKNCGITVVSEGGFTADYSYVNVAGKDWQEAINALRNNGIELKY